VSSASYISAPLASHIGAPLASREVLPLVTESLLATKLKAPRTTIKPIINKNPLVTVKNIKPKSMNLFKPITKK
jgi:hypothetical protein